MKPFSLHKPPHTGSKSKSNNSQLHLPGAKLCYSFHGHDLWFDRQTAHGVWIEIEGESHPQYCSRTRITRGPTLWAPTTNYLFVQESTKLKPLSNLFFLACISAHLSQCSFRFNASPFSSSLPLKVCVSQVQLKAICGSWCGTVISQVINRCEDVVQ